MTEFLRYQRTLLIGIIAIIVIGAGVLYAIFPEKWSYSTGLLWGGLGGIVALRIKILAIIRFSQNPEKPPTKMGFQQLVINLFFLGAVVVANHYLPWRTDGAEIANVWMAFAGIFLPNVVLMVDGLCRKPIAIENNEPPIKKEL